MDFPNLDSPEQPDFPDLDGAGSSPVFPTLSVSGEACSSPSSTSPEDPQHHPRRGQRQYPRPHPRSQQARNVRQRIEKARSPELDPGPIRFQSPASSVMDLDHHAPADDGIFSPYTASAGSPAEADVSTRATRRESHWQKRRPTLIAAEVARASVPESSAQCCCCPAAAQIRCLDCDSCSSHAATQQMYCADCDRQRHPHAHFHRRHVSREGCWVSLQPRQELDSSESIIVTGKCW